MAITLRTVTGSALSHNQLDTNFSSYFYSASISASVLSLHYTGSSAIGLLPRSSSVAVPNSSKWTDVAGGGIARNSEVQITGSTNISGSTNIVGNLTQGFAGGQASNFSHAEGYFTIASGSYSHAEGYQTTTTGSYSHAEGRETVTKAIGSHAEGYQTIASGSYSHAEGNTSIAIGVGSHAEGYATTATGDYAHAEGATTIASGTYSHAEGRDTLAIAQFSHAEGYGTIAAGRHQHVQGQYNVTSSAESAFIIGNGASDGARRNLVFASGSSFQITGSLGVTGSILLPNDRPIYFGAATQVSTSSYAIFRDNSNRLTIGSNVQENYGSDGIKIDTSGKVQLNHVIQNYGLYDTTLNIIGSGSNDGITMTQWPDTTNRYTITVQSGSQYKLNFKNSLHPDSGSFDFSGSVAIKNDLYVGGIKQFNHGMFYHTASVTVANGTSGSALLSTTAVANGVSIVSGSRITMANPGYYNIQFSAQLAQGVGTANYYIWFKKNGVNIANSNSVKTLAGTSNSIMTVDIIDYASNAGDYYEIAHQSNATNSSLEYIAASGNYPAAPSIIVSVQQVR